MSNTVTNRDVCKEAPGLPGSAKNLTKYKMFRVMGVWPYW